MSKVINIRDAKIRTAAIGIKALTISDKMMTLSVFRQLQEQDLIGYDGTLNGVPWGWANYHPDKCADEQNDHKHFVWQSGDELRRSKVYDEPIFECTRQTRPTNLLPQETSQ